MVGAANRGCARKAGAGCVDLAECAIAAIRPDRASRALKRENVNYFLVGLVTLAALLLLLVSLWMITGRSGAVDRYIVHYRNVSGLGYGTAVFYQGYRLGQVDAITPEQKDGKTSFRVDFSITRGWHVPQDSVAMQLSSGLLADVFIGITEGSSTAKLEPGAEIAGREGGDVFAAVSELAGNVSDLTRNKLTPLVDRLSRSVDAVSGTLESGAPALVQDALSLLNRLNDGASALNDVLGPQNRANLSGMLRHADDASGNVSRLTQELRSSGAKLDELIEGLRDTAAETRPDITDAMGDLRSTLAALAQRVDAITYNLESASRHFDEFSREIRRQPNRLLFSPEADKVKTAPERPSTEPNRP